MSELLNSSFTILTRELRCSVGSGVDAAAGLPQFFTTTGPRQLRSNGRLLSSRGVMKSLCSDSICSFTAFSRILFLSEDGLVARSTDLLDPLLEPLTSWQWTIMCALKDRLDLNGCWHTGQV